MILPKTSEQIKRIRKAGKVVAEFFEKVEKLIEPGISSQKIDEMGWEIARRRGAYPSFYNYRGYPAAVCVSINSEVIHGIPRKDKVIRDGDIVSVDYGVYLDGVHADAAKTFIVGESGEREKELVRVTCDILYEAIKFLKPGMTVGDLGNFIQTYVERFGFSVLKDYCGHGIGEQLHEDPPILNYGKPGKGVKILEDMVICIEPMVCMGSGEAVVLPDGWTVVTRDGSLSAHFEHTVWVKDGENEILTE